MAKQEAGTTSVIDGKKVSFIEFQARLGELAVDPTPTYTANIEKQDGSFGGTEEQHVARNRANGDVYDYMIISTATHRHYELTFKEHGSGKPSAPASVDPAMITDWTLEGHAVDERTFEQTFRNLEVDKKPWVNGHLSDVEGNSGTSASFEARDRKTGELWTYETSRIGRHSSRSLSRGSRKSSKPARQ